MSGQDNRAGHQSGQCYPGPVTALLGQMGIRRLFRGYATDLYVCENELNESHVWFDRTGYTRHTHG